MKYISMGMYLADFFFFASSVSLWVYMGYIQSRYPFHLSAYCFGCVLITMSPPTAYPLCPSSSTPSIWLYVLPPLLLPLFARLIASLCWKE
ncbi:hypothetical protein F5H01DRAFT_190378 [Linnemannia elongata]|nr:hypothetical protein F5H01DRAFT_190378 [Linnemannia elongata]